MTDAKGCIRTNSISIHSATDLTLSPTVTNPNCGFQNGTINIAVAGGSAGTPSFAWLPAGNTSSLTNIGAGNYTLTVTDPNGCAKTQVFSINTSSAASISFTQSNIGCFNACTGSIIANASGSGSPFTYNWSIGGVTTPSIGNLCKGIVTLTVTTSNNCISVKSFTLNDNPKLQLSIPNIQQPKCKGDCNGSINLLPSGGTLVYTYSWFPIEGTSNPQFSLCPGTYSVIIKDAFGCSDTTVIPINNRAALSLTPSLNNAACPSVADGSIGIVAAGGTPRYHFLWSGPFAFQSNSQNISNVFPGTYTLNLSDSLGCSKDSIIKLNSIIAIKAIASNDTLVCPNTIVVITGTNSVGAINYQWFLKPDLTHSVANTPSLAIPNIADNGNFVLVVTSSVQGCFDKDSVSISIFPETSIDAGPTHIIPVYSTVTIGGNPTSYGNVSFSWTPAFSLNDPTIANPVASNTIDITYTVTTVDQNGCILSDTMQVLLYPQIIIPNGFSPNGDGKNDKWIIDYLDQFPDNTVEVYNRWGEQLFLSKGYNVPFDGRFHGKDLPVGTYYYVINLNHPAYPKALTGPLTIFR
jgi:gliding motility-associated-like protein